MDVAIHWQDADSSSSTTIRETYAHNLNLAPVPCQQGARRHQGHFTPVLARYLLKMHLQVLIPNIASKTIESMR